MIKKSIILLKIFLILILGISSCRSYKEYNPSQPLYHTDINSNRWHKWRKENINNFPLVAWSYFWRFDNSTSENLIRLYKEANLTMIPLTDIDKKVIIAKDNRLYPIIGALKFNRHDEYKEEGKPRYKLKNPLETLKKDVQKILSDIRISSTYNRGATYYRGIILTDEPQKLDLDMLSSMVRYIYNKCPENIIPIINLYPTYVARDEYFGFSSYEEYVNEFIKQVVPAVLLYDYYPLMTDKEGQDFYKNAEIIRAAATNEDIGMMGFVEIRTESEFERPSETDIYWMAYSLLAYGAKGIWYYSFTYNHTTTSFGSPLVTNDGRPTKSYFVVQSLNSEIKKLSSILMDLKFISVGHVGSLPNGASSYQEGFLKNFDGDNFLIGCFESYTTGKKYAIVVNKSHGPIDMPGSYGDSSAHPVPADYDGDGKADLSVKADDGRWFIDYAHNGYGSWDLRIGNPGSYGGSSAHPVPADYDGDGKADLSVKTDDGRWLIDFAHNSYGSWDLMLGDTVSYGNSSAHPVPADYDGDGKADLSVKTDDGRWVIDFAHNSFGTWDLYVSNLGSYGGSSVHPVPADYDGDGKADLSVKTNDGKWFIDYAHNGYGSWDLRIGNPESYARRGNSMHPVPADYDGDGKADLSVKTDDGRWLIDFANNRFHSWDLRKGPFSEFRFKSNYRQVKRFYPLSDGLIIKELVPESDGFYLESLEAGRGAIYSFR